MLFYSPEFLFLFLPVSVVGYFLCARARISWLPLVWLTAVSLFFYAWWNPPFVLLLLASIVVNYLVGQHLRDHEHGKKLLLGVSIALNLLLLGYFKYANFFLDTVGEFTGTHATLDVVLPLGISFFTFEQIAWLVESARSEVKTGFLQYATFISFFPKLIAGPVVRPHELLPQLDKAQTQRFNIENISVGLTIFAMGLFKKIVLADTMSPLVGPVFHAAALGAPVTFLEAWAAAIAYTLQIYFDFSGYTDMAIGVARMFGLELPPNFSSPYKSLSIIDFWRRWHMSLSRLIRDYVYIPLGGSRHGAFRRYLNLLITMTLVGLWHGAGWTFVVWGALHGIFSIINQMWRGIWKAHGWEPIGQWWSGGLSWLLTFLAVVVGWVFFRAETLSSAMSMLKSMVGLNGLALPGMLQAKLGEWGAMLVSSGVSFDIEKVLVMTPGQWVSAVPWIVGLCAIALILPNTQQFMRDVHPVDGDVEKAPRLGGLFVWKPTVPFALAVAVLTNLSLIFLMLSRQSEFLYFQF